MNAKKYFQLVSLLLIVILLSGMAGCGDKKKYRIGFVGNLTGRLSDPSVSGRNGVVMAVEEINKAGGIKGHTVELLVKDDKQDPDVAVQVDKELINEGVVAIIGHMTAAMSIAAVPLVNKEQVLLISPTTSANSLSGIDDYFIRVQPPNKTATVLMAVNAFQKMGLKKMAVAYDLSNRAYSEEWYGNFKSEYKELGGQIVLGRPFTSSPGVNFMNLTGELKNSEPDGILIIAGAIDTAMFCQQIRKTGSKIPVITGGWAMTDDILQYGGPAVEGVIFSNTFDRNDQHEDYLRFKKGFKERFGTDPSFSALYGYEAARVLFEALAKSDNPNPKKIKEIILRQKIFQGLQGDFRIDKYGDAQRNYFLFTINDGQFKRID